MRRIGFVGASGYAGVLLDELFALRDAGRLAIAGGCVLEHELEHDRVATLRASGVPVFSRFDELLRDGPELDLCLIPTAPQDHCAMARAALKAGTNALVEKPLSSSLREADALIALEESLPQWTLVGFQYLYLPFVHALKQKMLEGYFGRIERIDAMCLWPRPNGYYRRNAWAGKAAVDGRPVLDSPIHNAMAHFIQLVLFWSGSRPEDVATPGRLEAELYRARPIETFDTFSVRFDGGRDIRCSFHGTHSCGRDTGPRIRVTGTRGGFEWSLSEAVRWFGVEAPDVPPPSSDPRRVALEQVLRRLEGEDAPGCSLRQARPEVELAERLHETCAAVDVDPRWIGEADDTPMIEGIESTLEACYEQGALISEIRPGWAGIAS